MQKTDIQTLLNNSFTDFSAFIETLSDHRFIVSPEGKWSAAQQLDHLIRSAKPVNTALGLPRFFLRWFGTPAAPSRSFEEIRESYRDLLKNGAVTTRPYIPHVTEAEQKHQLLRQFAAQKDKMLQQIDKWSEQELDRYQGPHPLLGKLTVREILYFTAYHNYHHLHTLQLRELPDQPWPAQLERVIF
ncbi:DinB family protein [Chitinophaga barathri]|uniref:DinB family protein n=1 Tax=Chitinophaga barathri TaxID=1647451 RepID=A0A3N4M6D5_9BACT|nr:DinB family protein [Chitinophaga barathri]RPD38924.1 DinB family protein [Chitinophaga barathri]